MGQSVFPPAASGPTLAEITTAITTNAAPASVTTSSITTAGNNAGWGASGDRNWTLVSSYLNQTNTSTISFTGLSGYKYYKIEFVQLPITGASGQNCWIYVNNNNASIYSWNSARWISGSTSFSADWGVSDRIYFASATGGSDNYAMRGDVYLNECNTGRVKTMIWDNLINYYSGALGYYGSARGSINTTTDITSIQIGTGGTWNTSGGGTFGIRLWGAN